MENRRVGGGAGHPERAREFPATGVSQLTRCPPGPQVVCRRYFGAEASPTEGAEERRHSEGQPLELEQWQCRYQLEGDAAATAGSSPPSPALAATPSANAKTKTKTKETENGKVSHEGRHHKKNHHEEERGGMQQLLSFALTAA